MGTVLFSRDDIEVDFGVGSGEKLANSKIASLCKVKRQIEGHSIESPLKTNIQEPLHCEVQDAQINNY